MIYIYDDGVHNNTYVLAAIESVLPPHSNVSFCTASMILGGCLDHAKILVMPGGADLYFCEKLNGRGNDIIRDFVKDGGSYFGICAGAYYACTALNWNDGDIDGKRELGFVDAIATGPVIEWIEDDDINKSWYKDAKITFNEETFPVLYNGGCLFKNVKGDIDVIATYTDIHNDNAAIIETSHGKGKVILASPHIEKFGKSLADSFYKIHNDASYNREKKIIDALMPAENQQKHLFGSLIERLLS